MFFFGIKPSLQDLFQFCSGIIRTIVVQIITVFIEDGWTLINLIGEITSITTDAKMSQDKWL